MELNRKKGKKISYRITYTNYNNVFIYGLIIYIYIYIYIVFNTEKRIQKRQRIESLKRQLFKSSARTSRMPLALSGHVSSKDALKNYIKKEMKK